MEEAERSHYSTYLCLVISVITAVLVTYIAATFAIFGTKCTSIMFMAHTLVELEAQAFILSRVHSITRVEGEIR
jgi:hypothetical protein